MKIHIRAGLRPFTLIELLVVIAIISILAALLLPSLKLAKEAALSSSCRGNMKQMALGCFFYAEDYREFLPLSYGGTANSWNWWWCQSIQYVSKVSVNSSILPAKKLAVAHCPSDNNYVSLEDQSLPAGSPLVNPWLAQTNYSYNIRCGEYPWWQAYSWASKYGPVRLSSIPSSSQALIILDGIGRAWTGGNDSESIIFERAGSSYLPNPAMVLFRHSKRINAAFVDGHVESIASSWNVPDMYLKWTDMR